MTTTEANKKVAPYVLTKGGDEIGIAYADIRKHILTPAELQEFDKWMGGQTMGVLGDLGGDWISIIYVGDLVRFLRKQPIID